MKLPFPLLLLAALASAQQWTPVPVATTAGFRGLSVVSDKVIWASGTEGTVIRTIDAGHSWSVITVPGVDQLDFRGIHAFDARNAVIISSGPAEKGQARIYLTTNGGKTWKLVFQVTTAGVFFDAIAFWDRNHGIVLSDPVNGHFVLFRTDNGGTTWRQISPSVFPQSLPQEGAFAASNSCLVVQGSANVWFATGGASVARVFRSTDRGNTWQVSQTPMHPSNASSGIFSLAFFDAKNGLAVGGDYQNPQGSNLPNVMRTGDGGLNWQPGEVTQPAGAYLSSVAFLPGPQPNVFVAVGTQGMLYSPGGHIKTAADGLNAVAVARGAVPVVWSVGAKGIVLKMSVPNNFHF